MPEHEFHLHAYSGRENGLMIIGDATALGGLVQQLQAALSKQATEATPWPREVVVINAASPYSDRQDFQVSLHLKTGELPEQLVRKSKSAGASLIALLEFTVLSAIGAVSLISLLWKAF